MEKKRIMALDVGEKRIGIAISDPTGTVVSPLMTYKRKDPDRDADFVVGLLREKGADLLLLGLPVLPSGKEGTQAAKIREFAKKLEERGIRVEFWDERYTTDMAMEILKGRSIKEKKEKRDALAAALILEEYLRVKI